MIRTITSRRSLLMLGLHLVVSLSFLQPVAFLPLLPANAVNYEISQPQIDPRQRLGTGYTAPIRGEKDWHIYRHQHAGFEIQLPRNLVITSGEPYSSVISFLAPEGGNQRFSGSLGIYQPIGEAWILGGNPFDRWYGRHEKATLESGDYTVLSKREVMVSGLRGVKVEYKHKGLDGDYLVIRSFIPVPAEREKPSETKSAVHVLEFRLPWDDSEIPKYLSIYDRMLLSLKFFNPVR